MSVLEIIGFCLLLAGPLIYVIIRVAFMERYIRTEYNNTYGIPRRDADREKSSEYNQAQIKKYNRLRYALCFSFIISGMVILVIHCLMV